MTKYRATVTETYEIEIDSEFDLDSDALYEEFEMWAKDKEILMNKTFEANGAKHIVTHRNWDDIEEVVD